MLLRIEQNIFNLCRVGVGLPQVDLINLNTQQLESVFSATRTASYNAINANGGQLPMMAFPEHHPYSDLISVNRTWNTFIVGTFPPVSYLRDFNFLHQPVLLPNGSILTEPNVPFYHGNENSLWLYLNPYMFVFPILDRNAAALEVMAWLNAHQINYFDVIKQFQRRATTINGVTNRYPSSDSAYRNILVNDEAILNLITSEVNDILIVTNTSSTFSINGLQFNPINNLTNDNNRAFDMILQVAQHAGYLISFSLENFNWVDLIPANSFIIKQVISKKVIFYLKINDKVFTIVSGPSPSAAANIRLANHPCYIRYCNVPHPGFENTLSDFRKYIYQSAINREFINLWPINV
jgi:hypothetical protein